ncbi:hypothetical protein PUN28_011030 [Cardiocondyla obscurior]|uniref:Secreted protein n=1 Tax=Cardiocondyla obscurior TaxID=286306 RepID=A0AAW2FIT5_9HYME
MRYIFIYFLRIYLSLFLRPSADKIQSSSCDNVHWTIMYRVVSRALRYLNDTPFTLRLGIGLFICRERDSGPRIIFRCSTLYI